MTELTPMPEIGRPAEGDHPETPGRAVPRGADEMGRSIRPPDFAAGATSLPSPRCGESGELLPLGGIAARWSHAFLVPPGWVGHVSSG